MEDAHIIYPDQRNYEKAFQLAYQLAREKLATIDIEEQCQRSGSQCQRAADKKLITIRYLNQAYFLTLPEVEITPAEDAEPLTKRDGLIMLHYFLTAKGTPPTGKLITFREVPEGSVYQPTFARRTVQPLLQNFGKEPDNLLLFSQQMGGYKSDYGDIGVTINAFSRVPITFVIWRGDDDFPSQGNVLFDANISDYLPTEDITVLCEIITWQLIRASRMS